MFNNIIYFIIALLVYGISVSEKTPDDSFILFLALLLLSWSVFAAVCFLSFKRLEGHGRLSPPRKVPLPEQHQRLVSRLSFLAVLFFVLTVHIFHLKAWIRLIPGFDRIAVLEGTTAVGVFLFYLATVWYAAYPSAEETLRTGLSRGGFVLAHLRLNLPILFPWWVLTLLTDLIELSLGERGGFLLRGMVGQMIFFSVFLTLLLTVMPFFIQIFWGCKPLENSGTGEELKRFLDDQGFRYRGLLRWPVFAGRMMTAGVMGIAPSFRYILVTDSLLKALSLDELKAVLAHEMGHVKYKHLLFYLLFFLGFIFLFSSGFELLAYGLAVHPFFAPVLFAEGPADTGLFYLFLSLPVLAALIIYFRYVMGFFMRHFERQADFFSARIMGSPVPTIQALEKIGYMSGGIRDLPSWHHFSIAQRVEALWRSTWDKEVVRRHNRLLRVSVSLYALLLVGFGFLLHFGPLKEDVTLGFFARVLQEELTDRPEDLELRQSLAMVYQQAGQEQKAIGQYRTILQQDPNQVTALNNLAWLLVTAEDHDLRDPQEALPLAERAASIEPSSIFLDTLAEVYHANGRPQEAVKTAAKALVAAEENRDYFRRQLERFEQAAE